MVFYTEESKYEEPIIARGGTSTTIVGSLGTRAKDSLEGVSDLNRGSTSGIAKFDTFRVGTTTSSRVLLKEASGGD
ncbi:hypothetical protein AMTR_s00053p00112060 [Amborella trichopoda]|uniref:Uncharacterized protein n=1 Tax=Amborella trichopoda TaxID=13333 RepID=W1P589_AMBTC|nr:hypothetical protein AMTR_s00053p00112060 [Amborella trichopoda]